MGKTLLFFRKDSQRGGVMTCFEDEASREL